MQSSHPADAHDSSLQKLVGSEEELASLRQHLHDVLEGSAFKSSHRGGQFLQYIVEQAIAGNFDSLKERVIGVELFGRPGNYDSGEDAIVRVTASDVRRRLLRHYGTYGSNSEFRIALPQGSYVPEITRNAKHSENLHQDLTPSPPEPQSHPSEIPADTHTRQVGARSRSARTIFANPPLGRTWFIISVVLTLLNAVLACVLFWTFVSNWANSPRSVLPWSLLIKPPRVIHIITSDANIADVQEMCGHQLSVSDYANHNYLPENAALAPELLHNCRLILSLDNPSSVDPGIAARIATLAQQASAKVGVYAARTMELTDFKTDDNYVLLGSPLSNPWSALFSDQLDFRFVFDKTSNQEIIRNFRPRSNESAQYVPTALGGGTGTSFAIIALVHNLDQNGQVLLLAGANAEGTEAVGEFATDLPRLSAALQKCGIHPSAQTHFELLLQLDTMAGSSNNIGVVACHLLSPTSSH